jgi:uroporphyrinogen decarboxylase
VQDLRSVDPSVDLKYVLDAIALTRRELKGRVPLIGFSGSPWTLLTYMVEGRGSKTFAHAKRLIYGNSSLAHRLLDTIADTVAAYLGAQMEAGADAVQIFDTWGGILARDAFEAFSLRYIEKIISRIRREDKPVIVFTKGVHCCIEKLSKCGADVLGLDWTVDIGRVRELTGGTVALQGNLDPTVLYAGHEKIKQEAEKILKSFGYGPGHVFNLGHGILPDIAPENLKTLVNFVKEASPAYCRGDPEKRPER